MAKKTANPLKLTFFLGKGGVGKTTVSTAYALHASTKRHKKVILISTDPAHSLADVLDIKLKSGMQTLRTTGTGSLSVWQVDAGARFQEFLDQYRDAITNLVEKGTFLSKKEIEAFLETALPGLAEVSALLTIADLMQENRFHEIVVDTAPIGHTLQLFRIPIQLARFLEFLELSGKRDEVLAQHFGGIRVLNRPPVLDQWAAVLDSLRSALSSRQSKLVMVTSAESFSLEEASRTARMLKEDSDAEIAEVILNRVVTHAGSCKRCQKRAREYAQALKFVEKRFPKADILAGEDPGAPIIGIANLQKFGEHVFEDKPLRLKIARPKRAAPLKFKAEKWPVTKSQLTFTVGKGGVGKTTVSGGLAYARRQQHPRENLLICSTDPAPSLDDLFEQKVGSEPHFVLKDKHFAAVEVDSTAEFLAWSRKVKRIISESLQMERGGVHVELSFEHEMISALLDIVPPGVDEIFAVFKLLDFIETRKLKLVIDMAPTGHALELLRTPERLIVWTRLLLKSLAEHRTLPLAQDLAVEVASISQRARELAALLKTKNRASFFVVMLPEPLPDRQTARLLKNLQELGLAPQAVFVNRLLLGKESRDCQHCSMARSWQLATLSHLQTNKLTHYAVPDYPGHISGAAGLKRLTQRLWQIH